MHVVGLVLLAVLLQAFSPLLHARLLAWHAAATGQRIEAAAFCLPGQAARPHHPTGAVPVADPGVCQLCQGGAPHAGTLAPPPAALAPPAQAGTGADILPPGDGVRVASVAPAHRPRGPPTA